MNGLCVYFLKLNPGKSITNVNIEGELLVGTMDSALLVELKDILEQVVWPSVDSQDEWGRMPARQAKSDIMIFLHHFLQQIGDAISSLKQGITLSKPAKFGNIENKPAAFMRAASNPDVVKVFNDTLDGWMTQIRVVLKESIRAPKAQDNAGPRTELDHWKGRMAMFNSITDQLKQGECKVVLGVLQSAKSEKLNAWKELDLLITDAANEAKDNVKYLYTLQKFMEPLYRSDPSLVIDVLPSLINAIQMMHSIARYYNTPERMTALFAKISAQMITCCRSSFEKDKISIWDQPRIEVLQKLKLCVDLNDAYRSQYFRTKRRLAGNPKGKQFDFSEKLIFSNFEAFCRRVHLLLDLFNTVEQFKALQRSTIEGLPQLLANFDVILEKLKKKPYNLLDHHKMNFESDYLVFNDSVKRLELEVKAFMDRCFTHIESTDRSLALLADFEVVMKRDSLKGELDNKYLLILDHFAMDLEMIRKTYEKFKVSPPFTRNVPPVAGSIAWVRQLLRKIEAPMMTFQSLPNIMATMEAKRVVKSYNRVASVLMQFEVLWHQGWCDAISTARSGLQATILIRHADSGEKAPLVNFDPHILELIRETKCLQRMGVEVPLEALSVAQHEDRFKSTVNRLNYMLLENTRVRGKIDISYLKLLRPRLDRLNELMEPGFKTLTWMSVNVDSFLRQISECLSALEMVIDKANDVLSCRIQFYVENIRAHELAVFPEPEETWGLKEFCERISVHVAETSGKHDLWSHALEVAVVDLISILTAGYSRKENSELDSEVTSFIRTYSRQNFESILSCVKASLLAVKGKVAHHNLMFGGIMIENPEPIFRVSMELSVPNIVISPPVDQIHKMVNQVAINILNAPKSVYCWRQDRSRPVADLKNFFFDVARNKDIVKVILLLTGSFAGLQKQVTEYLDQFYEFEYLWSEDKKKSYEAFLKKEPTLDDYLGKIMFYESVEERVKQIPEFSYVSSLEVATEPFRMSMIAETTAWKALYAGKLNEKARLGLENLSDFMEENTVKLTRKMNDLDDVRNAMLSLASMRDMEAVIDLKLAPIEDAYYILMKCNSEVSAEEKEVVDNLRYRWKKLKSLATEVQDNLSRLQSGMQKRLVTSVKSFVNEVKTFGSEYSKKGPMVPGIKPRVAAERLKVFQKQFEDMERKWIVYQSGEELFGLPVTEYPDLVRIKKELRLLSSLYNLYTDVIETVTGYEDILWAEIDLDNISQQVTDFQAKCRKLPKGMREWDAYLELKKTIDDFCETLPLLQLMSHPAMRPRHWEAISAITKVQIPFDSELFKLRNVLECPLLKNYEDIEDIATGAVKEADIEQKLAQVSLDWTDKEFIFAKFKNRGDLLLAHGAIQEVVTNMEDSLMLLQNLMTNRYNAAFKKQIQVWIHKMSNASEVIDRWMQVQFLWVYLEAVFSGGDIARQMPQEAKRFTNIDKHWVKIMGTVYNSPNIIEVTNNDETLSVLPHMMDQLELCQKSLSGYLEAKRDLFPRFFFVSDPQLLEILGQGSDPLTIQPHLKSIFEAISQVSFDRVTRNKILSLMSSEGEEVQLKEPMLAQGNIEEWLQVLVDSMQETLRDIVRDCATNGLLNLPLEELMFKYPAQVSLLGLQLLWTRDCEDAISRAKSDKSAMTQANKKAAGVLRELVSMTVRDLSKIERTRIETMVTIQVHQRDVFEQLYKQRVKNPQDFEWLKQTRFYWRPEKDDCFVCITDVEFKYCHEYLGCQERLVITPLTDRCYITLAQALGMCLGGAPAGPAGTGKTETVKDMGKCLGKYVVVFNCSDQMDYRGLGKIYKGIAQAGCWGDFDEFNRIQLEVLSVAAQQIACIFGAIREHKSSFTFTDGSVCQLRPGSGIFITMNPGYAGRQELPENLKLQFRSVAMMVPDRQIIMRVKLAAAGFQENVPLAKKFFILYGLCEQQLSAQRHYDFGLRNILSVLRTCGFVRRSNPDNTESMILMRVLRDMNLSKLVDEDEPLFLSLVRDLFPGLQVEKSVYPELEDAIKNQIDNLGLVNHPPWYLKVIQLYETQKVRHGIMVLGPSGAGKSRCIQVLMNALTETEVAHKETRMNPKAITATQMFGRLDVATNDWTDGIFSALWRKACKEKTKTIWMTLDGPVDTIWIESLNTVLDDNKTLTLANSDRIPMPPTLKLMFEVENLDNASPATVSRAGMIYMSSSSLGWEPVLKSWLSSRPRQFEPVLSKCFNSMGVPFLTFMRESMMPVMKIQDVDCITSCLKLLESIIPADDAGVQVSDAYLKKLFLYAFVWSIGGLVELDDRRKLHNHLQKHCDIPLPSIMASSNETIFDFRVNSVGEWEHWSKSVPEWAYPADYSPEFSSIMVPTVDNVRMEYMLHALVEHKFNILLIGESGTAKSVTIQQYMNKMDPEVILGKAVNFSSATTPELLQRTVEGLVDKRLGTTYGPPGNKRMLVFLDDVNMPKINEWGDQITNELLRQLVELSGFYNLERPGEWNTIADMQYVGAMSHPGGGKNDLPGRLKRHFVVFNCTLPNDISIDHIFGGILHGYFCDERGFSAEVIGAARNVVPMVRKVWQQAKLKLLPTPAKFHYQFNLRDLSRIFQGVIRSPSSVIKTRTDLVQLIVHEMMRAIADRFTVPTDTDWFKEAIRKTFSEYLNPEYLDTILQEMPWFVDFMRDADEDNMDEEGDGSMPETPHIYEPVTSLKLLHDRCFMMMEKRNTEIRTHKLNLVLFQDALNHLTRIARIISQPRGNALLIGVGGSGKQSLTRLASYVCGYNAFQITITRTYGVQNLFEDLKNLYKEAGQLGKPTTFLFTDSEVKQESFLEYINNILTSGEIVGLFPKDEMDAIIGELRPMHKKARPGVLDSVENLYKFFIDRVKDNLHICLCFSPVGEQLRNRVLKFPGLVSGCTIDWFQPWPHEALKSVALKLLENTEIKGPEWIKDILGEHMANVHLMIDRTCNDYFVRMRRNVYVTPKSFLSFVNGYQKLYVTKKTEVEVLSNRLTVGLEKLENAARDIAHMQIDLREKEKFLAVAQEKAAVFLVEITASTAEAEKVKSQVLAVKNDLQGKADEIAAEKSSAEKDLEAAKPALEAAVDALNQITTGDIATVKKLGKPPNLIKRIMDAVLLLKFEPINKFEVDPEPPPRTDAALGIGERSLMLPSWDKAQKMMGDSSFLNSLLNFNKDALTDEQCELVAPYVEQIDFTADAARKVCGNVAGLCTWIMAMVTYHGIAKEVAPKRLKVFLAEQQLETAMKALRKAEGELAEKQALLDEMQAKYDAAMADKQALQDDADQCKRRMDAANTLISGLGGEKERWTEQKAEFEATILRLAGDVSIATAFLSYLGPFNQEFRNLVLGDRMMEDLVKMRVPFSRNMNIIKFLSDDAQVGEWNLQGLPSDDLSTQNAIIVTSSARFPLLIDPQGQGKVWMMNRASTSDLQITSFNHKFFRQHLEDCLENGRVLLIEDVEEEIDPVLDPVLERTLVKVGRSWKVKVGDKEVDFSDGFSLCMTTKLANPRYTPEIFAKVSVIDFTVTMKGLEDQLLGRVILKEKQELEKQRSALLEDVNTNKKKVKQLEDDLLRRLAETSGNLLDDESLIGVLNYTKTTANEVSQKLEVSAETEKKINVAREEYRPVAIRGSILYFAIVEMTLVNNMYQTSLLQFLRLFDAAMDEAEQTPVTAKRMAAIISTATYNIYRYISRGLFESHKMVFVLQLALKIDLVAKKIMHDEYSCLIKGGAALDLNTARPKNIGWIPDKTWLNLVALSEINPFGGLLDSISRGEKDWKAWYETENPEMGVLCDGYEGRLNKFQRLLLIRCFCEDRTMLAATDYLMESLGERYVDAIPLDLEGTWRESDARVPLVCLLSMGSDPSTQIEQLAKKMKIPIHAISMGQGQEVHARRLVQNGMTSGGWVLLQNCHLGVPFLEEYIDTLEKVENIHETYRVWITTEPLPNFPITLLQMSIKITNEPPQGVKAGLKRTFQWVNQDLLDVVNTSQWRCILYTVCFLHTIVQERRKYGPLGWNIPYEFNQSDLSASIQFLQNHLYQLEAKKGVSWSTVRYMVCEVQYGGRVTDDFDRRLLNAYGKTWLDNGIFSPTFQFFEGYRVPGEMKWINEVRAFVEELPLIDTPDIFGLHMNADLAFRSNQTLSILNTLLSIQPKDGGALGGETREEAVLRVCADLFNKMPGDFVKNKVKAAIKAMGGQTPLNICLSQEVDRMQKVLSSMRSTLRDLRLAVAGTIVMNETLEVSFNALFDAIVPPSWEKLSWKSSTLGFWFSDVTARSEQFNRWLTDGRPRVFWLTGLFNPQGFLTAMRQEITRAHQGWSLDSVMLATNVLKVDKEDVKHPPDEGVYVHGLYLDGASWERKGARLVDSPPKVLFTLLPVLHVTAINSSTPPDPRAYVCPVYRIPKRTDLNYIFDVYLRTDEPADKWVLRGVCLLCSRT